MSLNKKGEYIPNKELTDTENIPLQETIEEYRNRRISDSEYLEKMQIGHASLIIEQRLKYKTQWRIINE